MKTETFYKGSLARTFAAYIVAGSAFISLLASLSFVFHEYNQEIKQLEDTLTNVHVGIEKSLKTSLWLTNEDMLFASMQGIVNIPHIEEVKIRKEDNSIVTRGKVVGKKVIIHEHPLLYSYEGEEIVLGSITITASKDTLFSNMLQEGLTAIGFVFLVTAFLTFFVLGLFYFFIGRHLQEMANYSKSLSLDRLDAPFSLSRKKTEPTSPDELQIVESALNTMRGNLLKSIRALEESEQRHSLLLSNLQGMAYRCKTTPDRAMEFVSEGCNALTGYAPLQLEENTALTYGSIIHAEDQGLVWNAIKDAKTNNHLFQHEYRIITSEKVEKWVWEQGVFVQNDAGEVVLEGFVIDINERKRAEETRRLYANIISSTEDLMIFVDTDRIYQAVNDSYLRYFSKNREEVIGKSVEQVIGNELYHNVFKPHFNQALRGQIVRFENAHTGSDGEVRTFHIAYYPFRDNEQNIVGVVGCATEITKLRKAEEEKDRLISAIEQAEEVIVISDIEGTIQYVNPAFTRLTGYSREEAIGANSNILNSGKQPAIFYQQMWATLRDGKTWSGTFTNKKKDGTLFQEKATISPVKNSRGQITDFVAVKRDITKEIALENQLRHAEKMKAIGTLTGGVAHDFNNILAAIIGYAEEIQQQVSPESQVGSDIKHIIQAGERATDLVKQLLTYSRKTEKHNKQLIQPHLIVKEALNMLRASFPSTIHIEQDIVQCHSILADQTNLHQIVVNLCTNAAHAIIEDKGTVRVGLHQKKVGITTRPATKYIPPGEYILLSVSDTGTGISQESLERIFEPYYTTKELSEGTGLGLSVVHGIISDCNGFIDVDSQLGSGSTFNVYFPVAEETAVAVKGTYAAKETSPFSGKGKGVLIVDDEKALVTINAKRLQKMGFTVYEYTESDKALEAFKNNPDKFDLVISDQTMPGLTGSELIDAILQIKPSIPTILCTGNSGSISEEQSLAAGITQYLMKPVLAATFLAAIQEIFPQKNELG